MSESVASLVSEQCYKARVYTEMEMCGLCKMKSFAMSRKLGVTYSMLMLDLRRLAKDTVD